MAKRELFKLLHEQVPLFDQFRRDLQSSGLTTWLVGGCIRDLLLGLTCADIDLVSADDPSSWARSWAQGRGHWFWLDQERRHSRILLADGTSFDLAPLRAATLEVDLAERDFTINAIALSIDGGPELETLIDPLGGLEDLENGRLKVCSPTSLAADPLRILKGLRHAACLNFDILEQTLLLMAATATQLDRVAGERIREELLQIVGCRDFSTIGTLLDRTGVLPVLFGCSGPFWQQQQYACHHQVIFDRLGCYSQISSDFQLRVSERQLFLFASFLRNYAPADTATLLKRLRLSRDQQRLINALNLPPSPDWLSQVDQLITERQLALAVEALNPCALERICYWGWCETLLADHQVVALLKAYQKIQRHGRIPDLLDGNSIKIFACGDQLLTGRLLRSIKELEMSGQIHNKEEALKWLRSHLSFDNN